MSSYERCRAVHRVRHIRCDFEGREGATHLDDHGALVGSEMIRWTSGISYACKCAGIGHAPGVNCNPGQDRPVSARDRQVGGDHYSKRKVQVWDVIEEYALDYFQGAVIKYVLRAQDKGRALEDYRKARHFLDKVIEREEARGAGEASS